MGDFSICASVARAFECLRGLQPALSTANGSSPLHAEAYATLVNLSYRWWGTTVKTSSGGPSEQSGRASAFHSHFHFPRRDGVVAGGDRLDLRQGRGRYRLGHP